MLSEKLHIRRLPRFEPPLAAPLVDAGRILTPSGELAPLTTGQTIRFVAYVEFAARGVVRANHYHLARSEWLYCIGGRAEARFLDLDTGEAAEHTLETGDLVLVRPRCAHAYRALERVQAIEFADLPYDGADTVPFILL